MYHFNEVNMNHITLNLDILSKKWVRDNLPVKISQEDWCFSLMDLSKEELIKEISSWGREQLLDWLEWSDPGGIYSDEDSRAEGFNPLTETEARNYIIDIITRED